MDDKEPTLTKSDIESIRTAVLEANVMAAAGIFLFCIVAVGVLGILFILADLVKALVF